MTEKRLAVMRQEARKQMFEKEITAKIKALIGVRQAIENTDGIPKSDLEDYFGEIAAKDSVKIFYSEAEKADVSIVIIAADSKSIIVKRLSYERGKESLHHIWTFDRENTPGEDLLSFIQLCALCNNQEGTPFVHLVKKLTQKGLTYSLVCPKDSGVYLWISDYVYRIAESLQLFTVVSCDDPKSESAKEARTLAGLSRVTFSGARKIA